MRVRQTIILNSFFFSNFFFTYIRDIDLVYYYKTITTTTTNQAYKTKIGFKIVLNMFIKYAFVRKERDRIKFTFFFLFKCSTHIESVEMAKSI